MPKIETIFRKYTSHINTLIDNEIDSSIEKDLYICPICLKSFSLDQIDKLSLEDAPPYALGGKKIAVTCKICNNTCGYTIDSHLSNFIKYIEEKQFLPGSDRKIKIFDDDNQVNGKLEIGENSSLTVKLPIKFNNPKTLENHISTLDKDSIIYIQDDPLKIDMKKVSVSILKTAYIILYSKFGYTFLLDKFYDDLRMQILNPSRYIIPDLWTKQSSISVNDGVYLSDNNNYKGFFVIFTLKNIIEHRFCICIPCPILYYEWIAEYFKKYKPGMPIYLLSLNHNDYLNNVDNIKSIKDWVRRW